MGRGAPVGLAAVLTTLAACSGAEGAERRDRTLVLTGSSTIAPLAAEIGKRFEELHPGRRIDVQSGGSSRGIVDVRQGVADIGLVSRALDTGERDLHAFAVARDGIAPIVHRDNPLAALSDEELVAIYTGRIERWSALGGRDAPITVVHKAEGRSTLELFLTYFGLQNSQIAPDVVIGDNEQGIKTVAGNRDAIAYVSIGTAAYDAQRGVPIRLLPLGGVQASLANVASGAFPISRPLNLVTHAEPEGLAAEFIAFACSPAVHDIIRSQWLVPPAQ